MFLVACAGTGEQAGYKQLTSADVANVTQGMTRAEVEQALGAPTMGVKRDAKGNQVLHYRYAPQSATLWYRSELYVTIDPASGKVMKVEAQDW
jgi:hypothetical protein